MFFQFCPFYLQKMQENVSIYQNKHKSGQRECLTMNSRQFLLLGATHFGGAAIFWKLMDHPDQCAMLDQPTKQVFVA